MVSPNTSIIEQERFLSPDEVADWYGVKSRVTLWRWRQNGRLPDPDINRGSFQRWKVRSLIEWDNNQIEQSRNAQTGTEGKSLLSRLGFA